MPPIRALKNQYLGINAHLHSLLQNESGWDSFHGLHVGDLTKTLQAQLLPMGYEADFEPSLQIRRAGQRSYAPESDVSIFDPNPIRVKQPRAPLSARGAQEMVLEISALFDFSDEEIAQYRAITIHRQAAKKPDDPIVWIELLSPSNKPGGRHFDAYDDKRQVILERGIVFVEIDYLHQSPPTFDKVNTYTDALYPYRIIVIDPHPEFVDGKARLFQFSVDYPIPTITIPLSGEDKLIFDFGVPYKKTFEEMFYGGKLDYSQLPLKYETYSEIDQQRIVSRMVAIKQTAAAGISLENEPQAVELIPLEEALQQLKS